MRAKSPMDTHRRQMNAWVNNGNGGRKKAGPLMKSDQMTENKKNDQVYIKKCHMCGEIMESKSEIKKCCKCHKSFLPTNYFFQVTPKTTLEFDQLFKNSKDLNEEDLIKGINVIW